MCRQQTLGPGVGQTVITRLVYSRHVLHVMVRDFVPPCSVPNRAGAEISSKAQVYQVRRLLRCYHDVMAERHGPISFAFSYFPGQRLLISAASIIANLAFPAIPYITAGKTAYFNFKHERAFF